MAADEQKPTEDGISADPILGTVENVQEILPWRQHEVGAPSIENGDIVGVTNVTSPDGNQPFIVGYDLFEDCIQLMPAMCHGVHLFLPSMQGRAGFAMSDALAATMVLATEKLRKTR